MLAKAFGFDYHHPNYKREVMGYFGSRVVEGMDMEIAMVAVGRTVRMAIQAIFMLVTTLYVCAALLTSHLCIIELCIASTHVKKEEWSDSC